MCKNKIFDIRPVTEADASRLLEIFTPYIQNTAVSFDWEVPSVDDFKKKIRRITARYPWLAAVCEGTIAGYAYASSFKEQDAYCWSVETSIYLDNAFQRQGLGRLLYEHLESILERQHIINVCACIAYPHPVSIAFHTAMGYELCGHFHQSGYKLGKWQDMVWMEKSLGKHPEKPQTFIPYPQLIKEE